MLLLVLLALLCIYFVGSLGKMGAPWGWYGEEERR